MSFSFNYETNITHVIIIHFEPKSFATIAMQGWSLNYKKTIINYKLNKSHMHVHKTTQKNKISTP